MRAGWPPRRGQPPWTGKRRPNAVVPAAARAAFRVPGPARRPLVNGDQTPSEPTLTFHAMNALGSPAAAGTDNRTLSFDRTDWLRLIGGMMVGAGALVLLIRKGNDWSDWAIFFALLIPAGVLLGLAFMGRVPEERQGWKAAFLVF